MSDAGRPVERPLSPHLMIYHPHLTMVMSILHRLTGAALYFGTLLFAWWLIAAASGPGAFSIASSLLGSWFGQLVLFAFTWALFHHMLGGIRHFIWDTGRGLQKPARDILALATGVGSAGLTILTWLISWAVR